VLYRSHTEDKEKAEQEAMSVERKLSEMFRVFMMDSQYRNINNVSQSMEHLISKVILLLLVHQLFNG